MARLRALVLAVVVAGAVSGVCATRSHAATPPPACAPIQAQKDVVLSSIPPSPGPSSVSSAHFDVWYSGDPTSADYITETQAGDLAAIAEQAFNQYAALGFPAPEVDPWTGKVEIYVASLSAYGLSSYGCDGSFYFDSGTIGTANETISVDWDIFAQVETWIGYGAGDEWMTQATAQWAAAKINGFPVSTITDIGPFEMSLDCWDPTFGSSKCSKNGYENLGLSRWPFYEYLAERFGTGFILEMLQDGSTAGDALTGLQNALAAHGTSLSAEFSGYAAKLIGGSWTATTLNAATIPISGSVVQTGATTADIPQQTFSVNHLATRYVEFDRGDGSSAHACYAATLKIVVQIPSGVTSQPTFYWNSGASSPVPLTVAGSTATATVPWDTCSWSSHGLLALPNGTTNVNAANFVVSGTLTVDFSTPASSSNPPAPTSQYGTPVAAGSFSAAPPVSILGPAKVFLAQDATSIRVAVYSGGDGTLKVTLGSYSLGSMDLAAGTNAHTFTLPSGALNAISSAGAAGLTLTLTPTSGNATGTAVTQKVGIGDPTSLTAKKTAKAKAAKRKSAPKSKKTSSKRK